jgi:hypothetical protein
MFTIDFFYDALRQHFDKLSASAQGPCKVGEPVDEPVELAEPTQKSDNWL